MSDKFSDMIELIKGFGFQSDFIYMSQENLDQLVLYGNKTKTILYDFFCPRCGIRACYKTGKLKNNKYGYVCPDGHVWEE